MAPPAQPKNNQSKFKYPQGVKEITDDLGTDELVRRLKACAQSFQSMGQDDDNQDYIPLAIHLALDSFLDHSSKDVRLLIACCIADVFRVYAPDAPYKDPEHLKNIFLFLIKQLRGLEDPKDPAFKRYFYLLENLAWVKSFNICIELEENQEIFTQLFKLMFSIVNDDHSTKVKSFMLDMMCPLISEADTVSQELLDAILINIIEPRKTHNKNAYNLARELLKRTSSTIEPYIQAFFNNALILGKTSESEVATHLYELIYELNSISSCILLSVLPQLEFKLKSNDEKERLDVTRLLARMFSDKDSELATQHQSLWSCFLGRFNDISVSVRTRCVQYSMHFLLNHPELKRDITEQLKLRQHDPEEIVRYEVVMAIVSAAKKEFSSISEELLDFVKERTLDKKFKIRKEALLGLAIIYKKCTTNSQLPELTRECVSWIKNKVLHVYYQNALEDRLLVERILHTCLVPYQLATNERMVKLYQLYSTVDENAVKAFNELLRCQNAVRSQVRSIFEPQIDVLDDQEKQWGQKIIGLAKSLPEPVKAQEFLKKFFKCLEADIHLRSHMDVLMKQDCSCKAAEDSVKEILKKLGNPVMTNVYYMTVKQLLERIAPVLIDASAVKELINLVSESLGGECSIEDIGPLAAERGLKLLHALSTVFPGSFQQDGIYASLIRFLELDNEESAAEITLQVFANINISQAADTILPNLIPLLKKFAQSGTVKQAKQAVRCLVSLCHYHREAIEETLEVLKQQLNLECPHYRTTLVSIGHIAHSCPEVSGSQMKIIISKNIVKELLMQDREFDKLETKVDWCSEEQLSDITKAKCESMKLMVRWLLGLRSANSSVNSTLKLLSTVILHKGDLMEKGMISRPEMSWLRLMAGCCVLKLCQDSSFAELITPDQFMTVASLITDDCEAVRERFVQKLHKGLVSMKLPLDFMSIFSLGGNEEKRELKNQIKLCLQTNIAKRRDYIKQHQPAAGDKQFQFLPDCVLPYAIHLLSTLPSYKKFDDINALKYIKECIWFLVEPLMKGENCMFSFFKRMLENIKNSKNVQRPNDDGHNHKIYAICDLTKGLILSKTTNFLLVESPADPKLPSRLFTEVDKGYGNTKMYLPREMAMALPKKSGMEVDTLHPKPTGRRGRPRLIRDPETSRLRRAPANGTTTDELSDEPSSDKRSGAPFAEDDSGEEGGGGAPRGKRTKTDEDDEDLRAAAALLGESEAGGDSIVAYELDETVASHMEIETTEEKGKENNGQK